MSVACVARLGLVRVVATATLAASAAEPTGSAQALRERFDALGESVSGPVGLPLHVASRQREGTLEGDVHARLDDRFAVVRDALRRPAGWCEIMILYPNVTGCRAIGADERERGRIGVRLGRAGHVVEFAFRIASATEDFLDLRLDAPIGPAGTTDCRILVEATPHRDGATALHLAYSQRFGPQARLAMDACFATLGRDKVGFGVVGRDAAGNPVRVRDLRGGLERNAMRCYLAIRSHLDVLGLPRGGRLEQGLRTWVAYAERWPQQLGEDDGYLEARRRDVARMRAGDARGS